MIIICHYNEIAIKGKNRGYFEKVLIQNLKNRFVKESVDGFEWVKKISGRILVKVSDDKESTEIATRILSRTPGIANFSFAKESSQDLETLKKDCWEMIQGEEFETFRITTQRSNKNFPMTSEEINREVGAYVFERAAKPAKMKGADLECFIEIANDWALIYTEKIQGIGGLPVGSGGKALTMLSGGIDSPVAAYYGVKRGVKMDFVHFHSIPYTSPASNEKVRELAASLLQFQANAKIFMVPFAKIQQEIVMNTPEKLRVVLYRRMMMRIAERLAENNKYLALYSGESVGQVASQTLENIKATEEAVTIPILRPLIGFNKDEIIEVAQKIGTFETSILPHEDCCTRFIPKHPETKAKLEDVKKAEENLDIESMIKSALEETEIEIIK
ncbi:tRNA uracil 4-sulfurtransferase ThiI [Patescibacteria group bacterium]